MTTSETAILEEVLRRVNSICAALNPGPPEPDRTDRENAAFHEANRLRNYLHVFVDLDRDDN